MTPLRSLQQGNAVEVQSQVTNHEIYLFVTAELTQGYPMCSVLLDQHHTNWPRNGIRAVTKELFCGADRIRTDDPLLAKQVL